MSTNFYLVTDEGKRHIGKRCNAGLYCHKCSKTLHVGGESAIHTNREWELKVLVHCPECGERIFDTTCSFTWAMEPHKLAFMLYRDSAALVVDEYGAAMSTAEFYKGVLRDQCRIQFYHSIGKEFS